MGVPLIPLREPHGKQRCDDGMEGDHVPDEHELSVGQLAARSGMSVSALHFYEREGLISSRRTAGNQRRYDRSILRRVAVIGAAQRVGIPLATVAEAFAELPRDGVPDAEDWQRMSAAWQQEIGSRIERLENLRDRLGGCIGCGCLSMATCSFLNPEDAAGSSGVPSILLGPR